MVSVAALRAAWVSDPRKIDAAALEERPQRRQVRHEPLRMLERRHQELHRRAYVPRLRCAPLQGRGDDGEPIVGALPREALLERGALPGTSASLQYARNAAIARSRAPGSERRSQLEHVAEPPGEERTDHRCRASAR